MILDFLILAAVGSVAFAAEEPAAKVTVDFGKTVGEVKPVHGVGQGPAYGTNYDCFKRLKEIGVPFARLHDVGGQYGENRYVDIPNVFRDFDADPEDPANYDFAFTDGYLKALVDNDVEPYYRLGVTIENARKIKAYRIHPPKDFRKWAVICEHVIRHYTEGWANGYKWKIRYWEIWNEPENAVGENNLMWTGSFADYCRLYEVASKHLKAKFPHLKIGGYGGCGFYKTATCRTNQSETMRERFAFIDRSFEDFLVHVKKTGCPLDFFSFHCYDTPAFAGTQIAHARRRLDEMGFKKTEMSVNEWLPADTDHGTPQQAACVAAMLAIFQNAGVDNAMIYDAKLGIGPYAPLFDAGDIVWLPYRQVKFRKAYWALKGFNDLYRLGKAAACSATGDGIYACAATDGKTGALLVANVSAEPRRLSIDAGKACAVGCRLTDATHDDAVLGSVPDVLPPHSFALVTFGGETARAGETGRPALAALVDAPEGIPVWDEALPLGNGQAGALVWGTNDTLFVTLDRADFWTNPVSASYEDPGFSWTNFVALCRSGRHDERRRIFMNQTRDPSKLPGVRLELKLAAGERLTRFRLDARNGSAHVTVVTPQGAHELVLWFEDDSPYLSMNVPEGVTFASRRFVENKSFEQMRFPKAEIRIGADGCFYSRRNKSHDTRFDLDYTGGVRFSKGRPESAYWRKFWREAAEVELPDPKIQRLYDLAIYLYGAGARRGNPPIALQGLWTADNGGMPPWHGDYHNDLNTEMTYWAAGPGGCIEALEGFADFYVDRLPEFRAFAKKAYGCDDGAVIVPTMSFAGGVIAGWNAYTLPATHGLWVFCTFCDAYDYAPTKEKAAKYLAFGRELAKANEKIWEIGANGVRRVQVSVSPEWHEDKPAAFMKGNTNYERAVLNAFYLRLARLAQAVGETAEAAKWRAYVGSFGPSDVSKDGILQVAADIPLDESHRHLSHLMEVFPLSDVPRNPQADYVRSVGDFLAQGTKWWVGYTFPWAACCDVRTGRGDDAWRRLQIFADCFVTANGFHVNGDQSKSGFSEMTYRPMTLEGNFGFARAVQELLVTYDWQAAKPVCFPAVPAAWKGKRVAFRNIRIPGGRKISATLGDAESSPRQGPEGF